MGPCAAARRRGGGPGPRHGFRCRQLTRSGRRHFHLDHVAALPNLMRRRSGFRARVFMTAPTKAVMHMLLSDYIRVTKNSDRELLFSETDLRECLAQIETVDFNQVRPAAAASEPGAPLTSPPPPPTSNWR